MHTSFNVGSSALRKGRVSCPAQIYFITSVCKQRFPFFANATAAQAAARVLSNSRTWPDARCLAWVLMPDHIHVLMVLGQTESLSLAVQRVKSLTAHAVNEHLQQSLAIWQRGFHDHALLSAHQTPYFVSYMMANPVRAGLVKHSADYPFQAYDDCLG